MIKVIDNFISEKYSQYLFDQTARLPWTFVPNLSYGESGNYDSAGFSCSLFLRQDYNKKENKTVVAPEYNYVAPMLLEGFDKLQLNATLDNVFRCRARLTLNRETSRVDDKHIDYNFPHLVFLYYINTTDGDTVIYENDKVVERIQPKRGRGVLFDGSMLHASSSSTLSPRIVLNTNILL